MANEPSSHDPLNIWQNQPTEERKMSVEEIRRRVGEIHHKVRRQRLLLLASTLVMIGFCVWGMVAAYFTLQRVGFALAAIWFLLTQHPWIKASSDEPADMATSTGIEYCRRQLELRRKQLRQPWRWYLGPVLLGIVSFLLGPVGAVMQNPRLAPNMAPFLILVGFWVFFFFRQINRDLQTIQHDIDDLNALRPG